MRSPRTSRRWPASRSPTNGLRPASWLRHLHGELLSTVRADIAQQEGTRAAGNDAGRIGRRSRLDVRRTFLPHRYDPFGFDGAVFQDSWKTRKLLRLALDLTAYGRRPKLAISIPGRRTVWGHLSQQCVISGCVTWRKRGRGHHLFSQQGRRAGRERTRIAADGGLCAVAGSRQSSRKKRSTP